MNCDIELENQESFWLKYHDIPLVSRIKIQPSAGG